MISIRTMTVDDVGPATEAVLRGQWSDRRTWFAFATTQPECLPLVAVEDGAIVGTGVGSANGPVGWVGTIYVVPELRGRGLGRALTQAVIDGLESRGCRTLVLVATDAGRLLYERMGFEVQSWYRILEAPGTATPIDPSVRPFKAGDLAAIERLDALATGEGRRHVLERFTGPESTRIALDAGGAVTGFVIRAPWGGGATIGADPATAEVLVAARRSAAGPERRVRVGLLSDNTAGLERLAAAGFKPVWSAPRMVAGEALAWQPDRIYGQFNHAIG